MELKYEDVNVLEILPEMEALFPEHYEELCVTKEYPYEPNYDVYRQLGAAGLLRSTTLRADGVLIGYIIFYIQPHLHYKSCITASEDVYFLKKEYRKGRTGIKLFQYAEQVLKDKGVNRIVLHTKVHLDNSRLFEYLGYKNTDKIFTKIL